MLLRRGKKYHARVFVPKDMIELFRRAELKKSLKTVDRREARAAAAVLEHKAQTTFLRIRTGMLSDREREKVSAELIGEFTGRMEEHKKGRLDALSWILSDDGIFPPVDSDNVSLALTTPKTAANVADLVQWYATRIEQLETELATEFYSRETRVSTKRIAQTKGLAVSMPPAAWFTEPGRVAPTFSVLAGYPADEDQEPEEHIFTPEELATWESPAPSDFNDLCRTVIQAQIDAFSHELERTRGKQNTALQQQIAARIEKAKPKPRLSDLWEVYRDTNKESWSESSTERNSGLYAQLMDILGNVELSELEDERQAIRLRDMLKLYPSSKEKKKAFAGKPFSPEMAKHKDFKALSVTSQGKAIDLMSSLIKVALRNRKKWGVDCNVFEGTQPKDNRPESTLRTDYEPHEIQGLVEALKTIRTQWEPEKFWVPLLALYTGARQNELCQLRTSDVTEIDGIPYIEICHKLELNQTTKTKRSRTCPLHKDLIDLGFLDYCRQQKHERLWPNLKLFKGKWQHEFSKWYCVTFRKKFCDPDVRKLDFHGLRHTFLNWFKQNAAVNFDTAKVLKSIAGHLDKFDMAIIGAVKDDMTFDRYGKEYKVRKQAELIGTLNYGVDLSQLKCRVRK